MFSPRSVSKLQFATWIPNTSQVKAVGCRKQGRPTDFPPMTRGISRGDFFTNAEMADARLSRSAEPFASCLVGSLDTLGNLKFSRFYILRDDKLMAADLQPD